MTTASRDGSTARDRHRVLVVGGHQIIAQSVTAVLGREPHLECVSRAADTEAAVLEAVRLQPDVILIATPDLDVDGWMTAAVALAAASPSCRLVLLADPSAAPALEPLRRARDRIISTAADLPTLLDAVGTDPGPVDRTPSRASRRDGTHAAAKPHTPLATVDLTLLRLVAAGYDSEAAARELRISAGFVRHRLRRICADLEVDTPTQAVATAIASRALSLHPQE